MLQHRFETSKHPLGASRSGTASVASPGGGYDAKKTGSQPLLADRMFRAHLKKYRGKSAVRGTGATRRRAAGSMFDSAGWQVEGTTIAEATNSSLRAQLSFGEGDPRTKQRARASNNTGPSLQERDVDPLSDSQNQILFGGVGHSSKLKNLLRGSAKYQGKLQTLVQ